jgi:lipoate-protein ligase A
MKDWCLLVDEVPLKGSLNMAVDEHLLNSLANEPRTFLRFYQWERPTASLGCSQKVENALDLEFCRANGIDIVRRMTGGKMVLHHQEITYSIASSDQELFTTTLGGSYKRISQALMKGLEKMGLGPSPAAKPPSSYARGNLPCFSYPAQDEIEVAGKKIVGSAQKRTGKKFLQHGSIPLRHDPALLKSVSLLEAGPDEIRMTSLSLALGRDVEFHWAVNHLAAGFQDFFGVVFKPLTFTKADWDKILDLQKNKYESKAWTFSPKTSG